MTPQPTAPEWTLIVPVKSTTRGKSRIALEPADRSRLARALALDTVTAAASARSVRRVLAVVENSQDGALLSQVPGVRVRLTSATSLNAAILDGLVVVPDEGPVAVLPGDLPGVSGAEVDAVLALAQTAWASGPARTAVIADRQGVGTTLLAAASAAELRPQYGPDSFRRHLLDGAVALDLPVDNWIRRDVDTVADLAGIAGGWTGEVVAELAVLGASCVGEAC